MACPWRAVLLKSLKKNGSVPSAKYVQLATISPAGRPANRTVVFRGFLGDSEELTFVTDARSRKVGSERGPSRACAHRGLRRWTRFRGTPSRRSAGTCPSRATSSASQARRRSSRVLAAADDSSRAAADSGPGARRPGAAAGACWRWAAGRALTPGQARKTAWHRMSDGGRSQFAWPHPGIPRLEGDEALLDSLVPESVRRCRLAAGRLPS